VKVVAGAYSDEMQFDIIVGETKYYTQQNDGSWEEMSSYAEEDPMGSMWIGKHDNQTFDYTLTYNGLTSRIHSDVIGTIGRYYQNGIAEITLPTKDETVFKADTNGEISATIDGAVTPQEQLPLGTKIDINKEKIKMTIPIQDRLRF
jgi:hypothetical protein